MASPAALSVYHILVKILQVAKCRNMSDKRLSLQIHYIGAEKELNHLPLQDFYLIMLYLPSTDSYGRLSELALLLPGMDITFFVFGKPAFELVKKAKKNPPRLPCD
jgi:hypothetical protein